MSENGNPFPLTPVVKCVNFNIANAQGGNDHKGRDRRGGRHAGVHLFERVLMNLTVEQKIVLPLEKLQLRKDHVLVVFKRRDLSWFFLGHFDLKNPPGIILKVFFNSRNYRAFSVATPPLKHSFCQALVHNSYLYSFQIDYKLYFKVQSPVILCENIEKDPLYTLQEKIKEIVGKKLRIAPWARIVSGFDALKKEILRTSFNQNALNSLQAELGISILGLEISRLLEERECEPLQFKGEFYKMQQRAIDEEEFLLRRRELLEIDREELINNLHELVQKLPISDTNLNYLALRDFKLKSDGHFNITRLRTPRTKGEARQQLITTLNMVLLRRIINESNVMVADIQRMLKDNLDEFKKIREDLNV